MKLLSEGRACLVAIATSALTLSAVLGFAQLMQRLAPRAPELALPVADTATVTQGRHLFLMNCAHCHGNDARGDEGPDLLDLNKSNARIHDVITAGIKGEMPSFAKKLNDADVKALTDYLRTLRS